MQFRIKGAKKDLWLHPIVVENANNVCEWIVDVQVYWLSTWQLAVSFSSTFHFEDGFLFKKVPKPLLRAISVVGGLLPPLLTYVDAFSRGEIPTCKVIINAQDALNSLNGLVNDASTDKGLLEHQHVCWIMLCLNLMQKMLSLPLGALPSVQQYQGSIRGYHQPCWSCATQVSYKGLLT